MADLPQYSKLVIKIFPKLNIETYPDVSIISINPDEPDRGRLGRNRRGFMTGIDSGYVSFAQKTCISSRSELWC